ncbi:hypothetical protein [Rudaea sp.]|uniref:hypothetical protein n=1 Tax=Rudaea sp. TaxID=2136325 RepID=UPI003784A45B
MMSSPSHRIDRFATTRWSVFTRTAATAPGEARVALAELVQRYWYPVYAYTRRSGHAPAIAEDIAHSFIGSLTRDFRDHRAALERGQFRLYLLERLEAFLGRDWREPIDAHNDDAAVPAELEARYLRDFADSETTTPAQAYERGFALEVVARALRGLRAEVQRGGHLAMYDALEPFLACEPAPGELDAAAQALSSRPLALLVALKRLRELAGEELVDTVTSHEQLRAEQAILHTVLTRKSQPP